MEKLQITTDRLIIRNLIPEDISAFHAYRSDPSITLYQGFDVMDKKACEAFIVDQKGKLFGKPGEWVQYAVALKSENELIGDCAIKLQQPDSRIVEIGMTISTEHQKKGFAKEAMSGIIKWLFSEKEIQRIQETTDAENIASIQMLKSLGFRQEGHFIENIWFNGKWGSEYQYALLKREWEKGLGKVSLVKNKR